MVFFSLWVTNPAGIGFDFVMIAPPLDAASSLSLDVWCLFWWVPVSYLWLFSRVAVLVLSQEETSTCPTRAAVWTRALAP